MKKVILATLAVMMLTASATALAASVCAGDRPQEYTSNPEVSYASCCGGGEPSGEQKPQGK